MPASIEARADFGLSVADAATRIGLTERTLWAYIASGRLRAHRIGARRVRVLESDLAGLLTPLEPRAESPGDVDNAGMGNTDVTDLGEAQ